MFLAVSFLGVARAQDAATEERLNKIAGHLEDLIARQTVLEKRVESLAREVSALREEAARPAGNFANQEDLKRLADALKQVDQKRLDDYDKIREELKKLGKTVLSAPLPKRSPPELSADKPSGPEKGYEYVVQSGDTLSAIVQAYRDKNIKITTDQVLKANPGLVPARMRVGQKLFIPAP